MRLTYSTTKPNQTLVLGILSSSLLFIGTYLFFISQAYPISEMSWSSIGILLFKTSIEIISVFYGFTFLFVGIVYLLMQPKKQHKSANLLHTPPVGIIYLCCNDLEEHALHSIAKLSYNGDLFLMIHDDSTDEKTNLEVDNVANELSEQYPHIQIRVLRRKEKGGGKAGAVNNVLNQTAHLYDYFILCDNDSIVFNSDLIQKSLPYFDDPKTAVVQYQSIGFDSPNYCWINKNLRKCIDAFHVLMTVLSKYGWRPFVGHNAMLRTAPVVELGGFTPGFFSDDLDMTIRLNLKGYKVAYGHNLQMGENSPPSYASFRKRTYKWAFGCMQSVRAHGWNVLCSKQLTVAEKFFFFIFTGFYFMQILLLGYMTVTFLIAPFFLEINPLSIEASLLAGTLIIFIIYLPFLAYFIKEGKLKEAGGPLVLGALVFGTSDFLCTTGTIDCLLNKKKKWIPTNQVIKKKNDPALLLEPLFGLLLLLVPLALSPSIFFLPCAYLWAGKFLFVPGLASLYNDGVIRKRKSKLKVKSFQLARIIFLFLFINILAIPSAIPQENKTSIELKEKRIFVDGKKFQVKGIHYSPWRPGTGPNKRYNYPTKDEVKADLKLISEANANTILVYDAPNYVLDLAKDYNLKVLYTFSLNWWSVELNKPIEQKDSIIQKVKRLKNKPALLGWVLGNEVQEAALMQKGNQAFEASIHDLYKSIKEIDSAHPMTHSNWPVAKSLNLQFLDFISFNVYPVWPPEIVARGYGNYIKEVLEPIAGEKPLLITEFGVTSLEAGKEGQSRMIKQCWSEIQLTEACGGIVFGFADEWWKNYDNPKHKDNYWHRENAANDESRHDVDPEEHYGILTADRKPKPAYHTVKEMFLNEETANVRIIPAVIIGLLLVAAAGLWYKGRQ